VTDKTRFKNNRLSASSLASLLSANHEDKKERKERKRTEKLSKHQQALQELRTAERRRAYFRDTSHRQELVFGPEVRAFFFFLSHAPPHFVLRNQIKPL
jgi:tellurite resistance protein